MKVQISRAEVTHADAIRLVYSDAYRENRELGYPASVETASAEEISEWISKDRMWVATVDNEIVGAVRLRDSNPEFPTLGRLGVLSQFKRQRIGKLLIEAVEHDAFQRGCKGITLTVAQDHPTLTRIYSKLGYVIIGPRTPQHTLYNEIVMRKTF